MSRLQHSAVAVTGGCGFIGSHLVRQLRNLGASVLVIDSDLPFMPLEEFVSGPPFRLACFCLGTDHRDRLVELLRGVDYVFHLAAEKHHPGKDPALIQRSNVQGTEDLLRAMSWVGVKKMVFTSSLYAYGRMTGPPMVETELPQPNTPYGISKLRCEHIIHRTSVLTRVPMICMRLFFTYGPGQYIGRGYKSVIVKTFERLRANLRPEIYGDGNQAMDYIYVDDVVQALILAMETQTKFGIFNVGSGVPYTINTLVRAMQTTVIPLGLETITLPPDWTANSHRVADTAKFENEFGIPLHIGLYEGLQRTWDWMRHES